MTAIGSLTLTPVGSTGQHVTATSDLTVGADSDASGEGRLIFSTANVERAGIANDGTGSGLLADIATSSDLPPFSTFYQANISATGSYGVATAQSTLTVMSASVVSWGGDVADASDTNYWTVEIIKYLAATGGINVVATKTTALTGGQSMLQRRDWNFDTVTFDATNKLVAKGDSLGVRFTKSGTATAVAGALMTIRCEPR